MRISILVASIMSISMVCFGAESAICPSGQECLKLGKARLAAKEKNNALRLRNALPYFDRAIVLNHKLSEAYARAGLIRMALALPSGSRRLLEKAIPLFSRASRLEPRQASYHAMLGDAYNFKGDTTSAQKSYDEACALDSHYCKIANSIRDHSRVFQKIEDFYLLLSPDKRLKPQDVAGID